MFKSHYIVLAVLLLSLAFAIQGASGAAARYKLDTSPQRESAAERQEALKRQREEQRQAAKEREEERQAAANAESARQRASQAWQQYGRQLYTPEMKNVPNLPTYEQVRDSIEKGENPRGLEMAAEKGGWKAPYPDQTEERRQQRLIDEIQKMARDAEQSADRSK